MRFGCGEQLGEQLGGHVRHLGRVRDGAADAAEARLAAAQPADGARWVSAGVSWVNSMNVSLLSHRGPDMKGCYRHPASGNTVLHERLAINDMECVQPLQGALPSHQVVHNGEIYNHRALLAQHLPQARPRTRCDSEVLVLLYQRFQGAQFCNLLDGTFAFVLLFDEQFLAARDPLGVKPLYFGRDPQGRFLCASELKALLDLCSDTQLDVFPPGHFYTPTEGFQRFYEPLWRQPELQFHQPDLEALREALRAATVKRLMSDAPLGLLLSGGLDSSLVW